MNQNITQNIAVIGGGPAALLFLKHITKSSNLPKNIFIFEKNDRLGVGMPYGKFGSCNEHVANVSANELPELIDSFEDFIRRNPSEKFNDFKDPEKINPYLVIPRLLLGDYLEDQFQKLIDIAEEKGSTIIVKTETAVKDIVPNFSSERKFKIIPENNEDDTEFLADQVVICTGHVWRKKYEETVKGWYDSPYPPSKFQDATNFAVAVRGTSLTAIDAVKTLARLNGKFTEDGDKLIYQLNDSSKNFRLDLFSKGGFLPALRFHSEDDSYSLKWAMSLQEIDEYKESHQGFVDLDYVFEINFKKPLKEKDPDFYELIKDLTIEKFVEKMINYREKTDSFELFEAEYYEAEKSITRKKSITWKEKLAAFSYAMNYPAKHFSAEDMLRLKSTLMPLITIIIASLPQSSYKEVMALHEAGLVTLIEVDEESTVEPNIQEGADYIYTDKEGNEIKKHYEIFVDSIGQQQMNPEDLPFKSLVNQSLVSAAYLRFKNQQKGEELFINEDEKVIKSTDQHNYYLNVPGLNINDYFQSLDLYNQPIDGLFIMAVPFIGGLNPDYSGLDFCDTAAERIMMAINRSEFSILNQEDQNQKLEERQIL
ncbi:FAD/NAD(P)-binding protein [Chryseobacterium formosus]|uniref:FAD/NAD(P)-binding protein n=1 Tax=Chryseobacterium formosus TaxID=1537363 RepID=A0ABT3XP18_9FLAO|nr:FAD/NAD(P)-binding protein [Chryseobacterium formosus]MCX8523882.1 FAD/NAD(P)-binding protein [Chryseobacterium formosus]